MEVEAILLAQAKAGESNLKLSLLTRENGYTNAYKKISKKLSDKAQPDLFDTATIYLERGYQGKTFFVKDYTPLKRRDKIPKDYHRFHTACRFTKLLSVNGIWLEDSHHTYRLTEQSLDAFNNCTHSDIIYLKSLYLLIRQEGYPVREAWQQTLSSTTRKNLLYFLSQPLEKLNNIPVETISPIIQSLEHWTRYETSLQISD
jgi:hypothetical protein